MYYLGCKGSHGLLSRFDWALKEEVSEAGEVKLMITMGKLKGGGGVCLNIHERKRPTVTKKTQTRYPTNRFTTAELQNPMLDNSEFADRICWP